MLLSSLSPRTSSPCWLLLCTLFTLFPEDIIFKSLKIRRKRGHVPNTDAYILLGIQNFADLRRILNRRSVKYFAYMLLEPFLKKNGASLYHILDKKSKSNLEIILLKQYFAKFTHNYIDHYLFNKDMCTKMPTKKEFNTMALNSLFFR